MRLRQPPPLKNSTIPQLNATGYKLVPERTLDYHRVFWAALGVIVLISSIGLGIYANSIPQIPENPLNVLVTNNPDDFLVVSVYVQSKPEVAETLRKTQIYIPLEGLVKHLFASYAANNTSQIS